MHLPLLISTPGNEKLTESLAAGLQGEIGQLEIRRFPDEETYLRFLDSPTDRKIIVVCTLNHPDNKILPLLLAYMRQDQRFNPGEAITSRQVARIMSSAFNWLVTVDPHLHRYGSLSDIYTIPTRTVHAAPLISQWIGLNVSNPIIIGPDSESEQWVSATARKISAPYTVLEKTRLGDREVQIRIRDASGLEGRTPVFVDDIISTGHTMIEAVRLVNERGSAPPICVAVHGLFADQADKILAKMGAKVVTCNTVPHATNIIDITSQLVEEVKQIYEQRP
jgi:ribose-phosphate pyrophosphokinase